MLDHCGFRGRRVSGIERLQDSPVFKQPTAVVILCFTYRAATRAKSMRELGPAKALARR